MADPFLIYRSFISVSIFNMIKFLIHFFISRIVKYYIIELDF